MKKRILLTLSAIAVISVAAVSSLAMPSQCDQAMEYGWGNMASNAACLAALQAAGEGEWTLPGW